MEGLENRRLGREDGIELQDADTGFGGNRGEADRPPTLAGCERQGSVDDTRGGIRLLRHRSNIGPFTGEGESRPREVTQP